jgi:hypothetical protein
MVKMTANHPLYSKYNKLQAMLCMLTNPHMVFGVIHDEQDDSLTGRINMANTRYWIEMEMQQILDAIAADDMFAIAEYAVQRTLEDELLEVAYTTTNGDGIPLVDSDEQILLVDALQGCNINEVDIEYLLREIRW